MSGLSAPAQRWQQCSMASAPSPREDLSTSMASSNTPLGIVMAARAGTQSSAVAAVRRSGRRRSSRPSAAAARAARRTGSGRRIRFWVEALQGEEAVRQRDERDVVVPAAKRASLEVIEAERVLELAVVELDAPAQLGEAHQLEQRRLRGCR